MYNISTFWAYLYCAGYEIQHPDYSQQNEPNFHTQKSLMIPKKKLEAINHRMTNNTMAKEKWQKDKQCNGQERRGKRTNNAMAKREGAKGQTMIYKSLYRKGDKNKAMSCMLFYVLNDYTTEWRAVLIDTNK